MEEGNHRQRGGRWRRERSAPGLILPSEGAFPAAPLTQLVPPPWLLVKSSVEPCRTVQEELQFFLQGSIRVGRQALRTLPTPTLT